MSKRVAAAIIILFANMTPMSTVSAAPTGAGQQPTSASPKDFVQSFYDWYVFSKEHEPDVRGTTAVLKQKKQFLEPALYKQLQADEEAAAKAPGEIVGLDFDPFVASNGLIYEKYQTGNVVSKGTIYLIPVYGIESGKKTGKPVLEAEVSTKSGRCVFSNFHYGKTDIPENENLLSVLAALRKERLKSAK